MCAREALITDEMICAGVDVLTASAAQDVLEGYLLPHDLVRDVYQAMCQVRARPDGEASELPLDR